jgi:hypothetical protein
VGLVWFESESVRSYSGGRDQEDHGLKPAQANSSSRPYLEKPFTKIGLVEWLKVKALSSSPSTAETQTNKNKQSQSEIKLGRKDSPTGMLFIYCSCTEDWRDTLNAGKMIGTLTNDEWCQGN